MRYYGSVQDQASGKGTSDSNGLIPLLGELGRLELDLLVRDLPTEEAVGLLTVLGQELDEILQRAGRVRVEARAGFGELERMLAGVWPGAAAVEPLERLAEGRRALGELDMALRPVQVLHEEVVRRSARRPPFR